MDYTDTSSSSVTGTPSSSMTGSASASATGTGSPSVSGSHLMVYNSVSNNNYGGIIAGCIAAIFFLIACCVSIYQSIKRRQIYG